MSRSSSFPLVGRQRGAPRTDGHLARPMRAVPLSTSRYFRGVERMPGLRLVRTPIKLEWRIVSHSRHPSKLSTGPLVTRS